MFNSNQFFGGGAGDFYPVSIDQSLRFNDNDSAYLSRTPASAGDQKTWTLSCWVKRGNFTSLQQIFGATPSTATGDTTWTDILFINDALRVGGFSTVWRVTTQVFRDPSAWYHIVVAWDTTQATPNDRVKVYVNGAEVTSFSTSNNPTLNTDYAVNSTVPHSVGSRQTWASDRYLDGYLAEVHFCDGEAYTADDFGELKSGVWVAKTPSVTYGTNGFYLDFANSADIGNDVSGEGNDWTPNNLTASDVVLDSPTDNFATLNPLRSDEFTLSDGNLVATSDQPGDNRSLALSSFAPETGKWYAEVTVVTVGAMMIGLYPTDSDQTQRLYESGQNGIAYYAANGNKYINGTATSYGASYTSGDVIGIALDMDGGEVTFYKNNVSQGAISLTSGKIYNIGVSAATTGACVATFEFGQSGFTYTPPTGYLALSTANLPDPAIDPAQGSSPQDYFGTLLFTATAGVAGSVTGLGFAPDFSWTKARNAAQSHQLFDNVRGDGVRLITNSTGAESDLGATYVSLEDDGIDYGSSTFSSNTYVAWNWKANGSGVSNTDGSITSTVSASTESGFSIVSYTGNNTDGATVGHGLNQTLDLCIPKSRDVARNWPVKHSALSGENSIFLNLTDGAAVTGAGNITFDATDTFTLNRGPSSSLNINESGKPFIAYCFHSVEGFSKFGSYTGNGSTDGPFIFTNFRPSFLILKRTDSGGSWTMSDSVRDTTNPNTPYLFPHDSAAEATDTSNEIDFLSNGFKIRHNSRQNTSGGTYIYMAFAENPFKYSNAR